MGANAAELGANDELVNRLNDLDRQMRELKTHPQPVGGDVLKVVASTTQSTTITLAAGQLGNSNFGWTLPKPFLTMFTPFFSVYVDATTSDHVFPFGSALSGGQTNLLFTWTFDYEGSNDTTGGRNYIYQILNRDTVSHTYTIKHRLNYPILPLS